MSITMEIDIRNLERITAYNHRRLERMNGRETLDRDDIRDRVINAVRGHAERFGWPPEIRRLAAMHVSASLASGCTPTQALMYAAEGGKRAMIERAKGRNARRYA